MKKSKIVGVLILVLIICLVVILAVLLNMTVLKSDTDRVSNNTISNNSIDSIGGNEVIESNSVMENTSNISDGNNTTQANLEEKDTINTNINTSNITNATENTTDNEVDTDSDVPLFPFEIQGINDDMSQYIKDKDELTNKVKDYIYYYGMFDATIASVQKYEYQESTKRLGMILKLNSPNEAKIKVIINENGTIDISGLE